MTEIRQAKPLPAPDSDALRFLPEGPVPLGDSLFSWVGIQHGSNATAGSLNLFNLATGVNQSFDLPGRPGFAFACEAADTFVVGCERSLGLFNTATGSWQPFCDGIDADVDNTIINDGMIYEDNLIFGTKDLEFATKKAGLYLYRGSDKQLIRLRDDQICSNGKAILRDTSGGLRLIDPNCSIGPKVAMTSGKTAVRTQKRTIPSPIIPTLLSYRRPYRPSLRLKMALPPMMMARPSQTGQKRPITPAQISKKPRGSMPAAPTAL